MYPTSSNEAVMCDQTAVTALNVGFGGTIVPPVAVAVTLRTQGYVGLTGHTRSSEAVTWLVAQLAARHFAVQVQETDPLLPDLLSKQVVLVVLLHRILPRYEYWARATPVRLASSKTSISPVFVTAGSSL